MSRKVSLGYSIPVGESYRKHVNQTYEAFLSLARDLSPESENLTDNAYVAQLQDLYFLFQEGILRINEGQTREGEASLFLEVQTCKEAEI